MRKSILAIGISVLSILCCCCMAHAVQQVGFSNLEGFYLNGPDSVRAGEPVFWQVCVTNGQSSTTRTDVAVSVHAISYTGEILFPIGGFVSTNNVPPFGGTNLTYHLNADWYPTNAVACDNIQIFAFVRTEIPTKSSVAWIRPDFVATTNEMDSVLQ